MSLLYAFLLIVLLFAGWVLTLLGMPGNWLMVAAAAAYAWLVPEPSKLAVGWQVVAALAVLATLGEIVEFIAGALGVAKVGGSRRGALLALVGSAAGALVGIFVGVPVPVIGPVIAAVLFAGLGALGGAMLGEIWKGRSPGESWQIGKAAFWGRVFGTLAKTVAGSVMVVVALAALLL